MVMVMVMVIMIVIVTLSMHGTDEEKDEVFGDDMDDSQDEANQITEYADETDLWGSDQETERINDYWLD